MLAVFTAGLSIGWLGHSWLGPGQSISATSTNVFNEGSSTNDLSLATNNGQITNPTSHHSNDVIAKNRQEINVQGTLPDSQDLYNGSSVTNRFKQFLNDRQYQDAINLYQEQKSQNTEIAAQLRIHLIDELKRLTDTQQISDFSMLIDHYLSAYYDDVDILLLLADFNQANGSYLEVVDVYLLAKTYAYTDIDQQRILNRFNSFVNEIDNLHTTRENWWSLTNFYAHINTSGLMNSTYQYQQALAHLRSGDKRFAIEQFNQLLNDRVAGEAAADALNNLDNHTSTPAPVNTVLQDQSESIALQRIGNQFVVRLSNNQQDNVKLLIDTGASMTTISSASFNTLGIGADAVEQERRVFRTAGGVVMGTVYIMPELRLGPYLLHNTQVAVIDFETHQEIDGLLGMNILGQFRFQIDQENTQLQLSKK